MGDFEPGDKEICTLALQKLYDDYLKLFQRGGDWLLPDRPRPSEDMTAFIKRLGQLVLIFQGRGNEIKSLPPEGSTILPAGSS